MNGMKKIMFVCTLLFFPFGSNAQVLFSEIAWMGTDSDANNEWIEIYNFSNTPTDLAGWKLESDDGALSISLGGVLTPHQVVVLERTDDDTLPGVTAFLTYTGGLSNEGRTLTIKDQNGAISDQAVGGTNWEGIGGSNTVPKKTAQRTRTGTWVTGTPTPGAENVEVNEPVDTNTNNTNETNNTTNTTNTTVRTTRSGGGSSKKQSDQNEPGVLSLSVRAPKVAYVNEPVRFVAEPSGIGPTLTASLKYEWNFGDMHTDSGREVTHRFAYPGTYLVFGNAQFAKQNAYTLHEIEVREATLTLRRTVEGNVVITNETAGDMDMSGFTIVGDTKIEFPPHTFIKAKKSITLPKNSVAGNILTLHDTLRAPIAMSVLETSNATTFPKATPAPVARASKAVAVPDTVSMSDIFVGDETSSVVEIPLDTVIEIGAQEPVREEGFLTRLFKKIGGIFGS